MCGTIVAVGVSLNVAIPNLVMDAVNAAYQVVRSRDAVAGIPADYGQAIIDNTPSLLATVTTADAFDRSVVGSAVITLKEGAQTSTLSNYPTHRRTTRQRLDAPRSSCSRRTAGRYR